ncbi:hypothetical protein [Methylocapsa acidiphila]|uniref:hypothetical protein n=1 Tax=Methylocapsa acidiphila TaxID=133552 RepID=UPI0004239787|nr:hypothetical protein [Methylocapsa acidiphila]
MNHADFHDILEQVAATLPKSAAEIDHAFARAGERLGRGMDIFESLNAAMIGLSTELSAGGMQKSTQALADLAHELRALSDSLPAETAMLQSLSKHNMDASSFLIRLLENMRMMTVLARAARIEAAAVRAAPEGFADFTSEILQFTRNAQDSITSCARHQTELAALLRSAMKAQSDFERQYRAQLASLSRELTEIFAAIQEKRGRSGGLADEAAAHSRKLAQSVGAAITSLQGGDAARQRLEHVGYAIATAERMRAEIADENDDDWPVLDLLCRLQAAQLDAAAEDLGRDLADIADALRRLGDDTTQLTDLGRNLFGAQTKNGASFLDALRAKLSEALTLIRKCESAHALVERVTSALDLMLEQFQETVSDLNTIIFEIIRIGINAGLKASRLGAEGRGLVVIAQELKDVAKRVSDDARALTPIVALIQATAGVGRKDMRSAGRIEGAEHSLRSAMDQLDESDLRLTEALSRLVNDGVAFADMLHKAERGISSLAETSLLISESAEALRAFAIATGAATGAEPDAHACRAVDALMRGVYTMATERKIHASLVGEVARFGLDQDEQGAGPAPMLVA